VVRFSTLLERAETATRSSKRVQLVEALDWVELVRDVAAMANAGGGVIVVAGTEFDEESLHDRLERYVEPEFDALELRELNRADGPATALVVDGVVGGPLVFSEEGRGLDGVVFPRGAVFFRHGAKSEPARGEDVRDFIRHQLDDIREQWLRNIRAVMHAPGGAEIAVVETAERDEEGRPRLIRLTTDPSAPLYGQIDPDLSHPYRQKEVITEVNKRLDGAREVNAFDVLSVRRVHEITEETRPEFVHVPKFGSPQYSDAFVDWLVERDRHDPEFFARAKARYIATRPRSRRGSQAETERP